MLVNDMLGHKMPCTVSSQQPEGALQPAISLSQRETTRAKFRAVFTAFLGTETYIGGFIHLNAIPHLGCTSERRGIPIHLH